MLKYSIVSFLILFCPAFSFTGSTLVVGANGKTGREVVYQSLKSGKNVVGLVRSNKPIFIPPGSAQTDGLSTRVEIEEHLKNCRRIGNRS